MSRKRNKKWIELDRERSGRRHSHGRGHLREPDYYDGYGEDEAAGEPEYYDEDDGYEPDAESVYYDEYDEEDAYDGYGPAEESVYDEGYYEEDGAFEEEPVYDEGYYEEARSFEEEPVYDEGYYEEDGAPEEEPVYDDGYYEEDLSYEEEPVYDEGYYEEDGAPEEEPVYDEGYGRESAPVGEPRYYDEEPEEDLEEAPPRRKKKKGNRLLFPVLGLLFLLGVAGGFFYGGLPGYFVKEELTLEAGESAPGAAAFLKRGEESDATVSGIEEGMVLAHVEDIPVTVHVYFWDVPCVVHVTDTTAPELVTKDKTIMLGESCEVQDFVESLSDATDCEVLWVEEPEITAGGTYTLLLAAVDEGGNRTEAKAQLEVVEDTTAPVIEGVQELTAGVGESVSYKRGVTVTDDHDEEVKLEIDNSRVDLDTPGDYEVVYSATDRAGNRTEISTILHVIEESAVGADGEEVTVTEDMVNAQADKILAEITDSSMSQYEVIQAIYNWCNKKIAYLDGVPKTNWVVGAYEGLIERQGDCYTFAMSSKCLLNRAGIKNMDIERVRIGDSMHFWNLVDIGEGWHHFDTCRRGDGATFFYLTDAELMAYSEAHISSKYPNGTHYYDRSLYPVIP